MRGPGVLNFLRGLGICLVVSALAGVSLAQGQTATVTVVAPKIEDVSAASLPTDVLKEEVEAALVATRVFTVLTSDSQELQTLLDEIMAGKIRYHSVHSGRRNAALCKADPEAEFTERGFCGGTGAHARPRPRNQDRGAEGALSGRCRLGGRVRSHDRGRAGADAASPGRLCRYGA